MKIDWRALSMTSGNGLASLAILCLCNSVIPVLDANGAEAGAVEVFSPALLLGIQGRYLRTYSGDIYLVPDQLFTDTLQEKGRCELPPPPGFYSRRHYRGWRPHRSKGGNLGHASLDGWRNAYRGGPRPRWRRGERYSDAYFPFRRYPHDYPNY